MILVHGRLEGEQLQRWLAVRHRFEALEMNPDAYSQSETEQIVMAHLRFLCEVKQAWPNTPPDMQVSRIGEVYTGEE